MSSEVLTILSDIEVTVKSYNQACALAKTLDLIGDRWTLLIVRELLIREVCRYTDIRNALPGIATNLLAERLKQLEGDDIVCREEAPPPIATAIYRLTERGQALERAILELGRWGAPLLATRSRGAKLQPHWLVLPLKLYLRDLSPKEPKVAINVQAGGESISIVASQGHVAVRLGAADRPDAVVKGKPEGILRLLTGRTSLSAAEAEGIEWTGARTALSRVAGNGASMNNQ
jgi:DNA-binding HxlR family transcriptional regulator